MAQQAYVAEPSQYPLCKKFNFRKGEMKDETGKTIMANGKPLMERDVLEGYKAQFKAEMKKEHGILKYKHAMQHPQTYYSSKKLN